MNYRILKITKSDGIWYKTQKKFLCVMWYTFGYNHLRLESAIEAIEDEKKKEIKHTKVVRYL